MVREFVVPLSRTRQYDTTRGTIPDERDRGVEVTRKDKLIVKLLSRPPDMLFGEVEALLRHHGFVEETRKGKTGSHHVFRNREGRKITVPKKEGQRVKRTYLEMIVDVLQLEE